MSSVTSVLAVCNTFITSWYAKASSRTRSEKLLSQLAGLILLGIALLAVKPAQADPGWNTWPIGGGTVVRPATTVMGGIEGHVMVGHDGDAIQSVELYWEGDPIYPVASQYYSLDIREDMVDTPQSFTLMTQLPPGTHRLFVVATSAYGESGTSPVYTITVTGAGPQVQSITFSPLSPRSFGDGPVALAANATSGLPVTFSSLSPSVCSISGSTASILAAGACNIAANQSGNADYYPAPQAEYGFIIAKANQSISFAGPAQGWVGTPISLSASASSGLATSFSSSTTGVCTVSGSTANMVGVGTCTITVSQSGNGNYNAATSVSRSFAVSRRSQTISFGTLPAKTYGDPNPILSATASSGLAVTFSTTTPSICSVSGTSISLLATGTCTIAANQSGNASYNPAPQVTQSFSIAKKTQSITFAGPTGGSIGIPISLTASASSGLAVGFSSSTTGVCTISGSTANMVGVGTCTITASQSGNGNYNAATSVSRSFAVSLRSQTISFGTLPAKTYGDPSPILSATASSGLAVTFSTTTPSICSVSGTSAKLLAAGTCAIAANQSGNATYNPAPQVTQSFSIAKKSQSITFAGPASGSFGSSISLSASASSGLSVTFASSTTGICTVSGNTANLVGNGTCTITASQSGNGNFSAAASVSKSFTVSQSSAPLFPVQITPPHLNSLIGGTLPGDLSVNNNGAATYSIALAVPAGTAGLQPELSLSYNSQGTNGLLGLGWSLNGMSSIHRCGKTIAQDNVNERVNFTTTDRLCLDGQRLILVNRPDGDANYWLTGAEYRTEVESFSRVTMEVGGSNRRFKVELKDGRIMYYGAAANSTNGSTVKAVVGTINAGTGVCGIGKMSCPVAAKPDALSWALDRVEDRYRNFISFSYTQNMTTGEHRPSLVQYGGNGMAAHAGVVFNYEGSDRPDAWTRYLDQARNDLRSRLKNIQTYVYDSAGNTLVREYKLAYEQSPTSGRSMLKSVEVCARGECLPATTFTWGKPAPGVTPGFVKVKTFNKAQLPILTTHHKGSSGYHPDYFAMADFENHGLTDILEKRVGGLNGSEDFLNNPVPNGSLQTSYRYFHNKGGDFDQYTYRLSTGEAFVVLDVGDFDGDGAPDLLANVRDSSGQFKSRICISPLARAGSLGTPGSTITFNCNNSLAAVGSNATNGLPYLIDVKGNGKSAIYSQIYHDPFNKLVADLCIEGVCQVDPYPPTEFLPVSSPDPGTLSPEPENAFIKFSQIVDFAGTGKPAAVRWSEATWVGTVANGESSAIEVNTWFNLVPFIKVPGFKSGVDSNTSTGGLNSYTYVDKQYKVCYDVNCTHREPYRFDGPIAGQSIAADFNGSGYSSLVFGFRDRSPTATSTEPWFNNAELTVCLSTGRELDCKVRRKYSGTNYQRVRAVGDFVGDGAPAVLVGDTVPQMCRLYGDDTTGGAGTNDTNVVCTPWAGTIPAILEGQETWMVDKAMFLDLLGTGRSQMVVYHPGKYVGSTWQENDTWDVYEPTDLAKPHEALDRIVRVTNGTGMVSTVEYEDGLISGIVSRSGNLASSYPRRVSASTGKYASRVLVQHGGSLATVASRRFRYQDPVTDLTGRGWLGFARFLETDELTGIEIETSYLTAWPLNGLAESVVSRLNGVTLSDARSRFEARAVQHALSGKQSWFVANLGGTIQSRDLNGKDTGLSTTGGVKGTDIEYDAWGNMLNTRVVHKGGEQSLVFTSDTVNVYVSPDITHWLIGLVSKTTQSKLQGPDGTAVARTVNFEYEANFSGKVKSETVQAGNVKLALVTTYERTGDVFGNVRKKWLDWTDPETGSGMRRLAADTLYDANGRFATTVTNAVGHAEVSDYDAGTGARILLTDANNLTTSWKIDGFGRQTREMRPDGSETRSSIKRCVGDSACPSSAAVVNIIEHFHGANRVAVPSVTYVDALGRTVRSMTWGFDGTPILADNRHDDVARIYEEDQPHFQGAAAMLSMRKELDVLKRETLLRTLNDSGGNADITTQYDGLLTTTTNSEQQKRVEKRDVQGKLRVITDALLHDTSFDYDGWGNLAKTVDPNRNVITVRYDDLGRKTELKDPDLGWMEYHVNPLGLTWKQVSPNQRSKGTATLMHYDALNRMVDRLEDDLKSYWIFDKAMAGDNCQATRSCGALIETYTGTQTAADYRRSHSYDLYGRPSEVKLRLFDGEYTDTSSYDDWGRLSTQTYKRGTGAAKNFYSRYNAYGYLARIERDAKVLWTAQSQDAHLRTLTAQFGNGLVQTREYYPGSGRLKNGLLKTSAGGIRLQEGYTYNSLGNVLIRSQYWDVNGFNEMFDYDALNRLKLSRVTGSAQQDYEYDDVGNILRKTGVGTGVYSYPAQGANAVRPHAVQSIVGVSGQFQYDLNGNLLSDPWRTTSWTNFDMPKTIKKGSTTSTFSYGSEHQRTRQVRIENGVTTTIVYAGTQEVEISGANTTVKTYWPNGIGVEIDRPGSTSPELSWTNADRLGSIIGLTKEDGTFRERLAYDAWGKRRDLNTSASPDSIDGSTDNKGFTGHEMLDQVDLVHMNGRLYDPFVARFMSGDPIIQDPVNGQNYNRYTYVFNNPTNLTDPTGFSADRKIALTATNILTPLEEVPKRAAGLGLSGHGVELVEVTDRNGNASTVFMQLGADGVIASSMKNRGPASANNGSSINTDPLRGNVQTFEEYGPNHAGTKVRRIHMESYAEAEVGTMFQIAAVGATAGLGGTAHRTYGLYRHYRANQKQPWSVPKKVTDKFPEHWGSGTPNKKGVGERWQDPKNPGNGVRIDEGNPLNSQPVQQVDHVVVRHEGRVIGRDGQPIQGSIKQNPEAAHIPLTEYMKWKTWFSPK